MTVNNTRPLCDFLALRELDGDWRHECAFELLILGIANHEVGYLSHNSTDVLCQSSPGVFGYVLRGGRITNEISGLPRL